MPRSPDQRRVSRSASRSRSPAPEKRKRRRSNTYSRSRSPSPSTCKRLHIANLDDSVRRRDIEDAFGKFGKLEDIWVASYPPLYGFVVYQDAADAQKALSEMKSGYIKDCHIRTTVALPRNSGRRPPPRRNRSRTPDRYNNRSSYRSDRNDRNDRNDRRRDRSPDNRRRRSRS